MVEPSCACEVWGQLHLVAGGQRESGTVLSKEAFVSAVETSLRAYMGALPPPSSAASSKREEGALPRASKPPKSPRASHCMSTRSRGGIASSGAGGLPADGGAVAAVLEDPPLAAPSLPALHEVAATFLLPQLLAFKCV